MPLPRPVALPLALRAALWRQVEPRGPLPQAGHVVLLALGLVASYALIDWVRGGEGRSFQLYGLNSAIAHAAATVALIALVAARGAKPAVLAPVMWLVIVGAIGLDALARAMAWLPRPEGTGPVATGLWFLGGNAGMIQLAAYVIWLSGAIGRVLAGVEAGAGRRPRLRGSLLAVGLVAGGYLLPTWPVFTDRDFDRTTANVWELASAYRAAGARPTPEEVETENRLVALELDQPALLDRSLQALAERDPAATNLFTVGVGGWSRQDVFLKEIRGSLAVLAERLGHADRTAALLNHTSTTAEAPLATIASLAALLRGIARRMDLERDVLVLVLTSHGTREGIALEAGSLVRRVLSPANLRLALDEAGIRNRIVIVSSCYSGTFVPALADDHTVVVTASSADTTSFGCSNEREWTFFGDAFFNHGMREQAGLPAAFARARALVSAWESERGLPASNPQISVGSAIRDLLPGLLGQAPVRHVEAGDERPGVMR